MNIVFFCMTMKKGGAERVISTLCNSWDSKDLVSVVTCLDDVQDYELREDVSCLGLIPLERYQTEGKLKTLPDICRAYVRVMKRIKPDVVVCFLPEPCLVATLMNSKVKALLIGSERGNPYYRYRNAVYKNLMEWTYRRMDGVVFQTEGARHFFGEKVRDASLVIGNPVDEHVIMHRSSEARQKTIVSVGRFIPEKNYPMLMKAFSQVHQEEPEYVLHVFGRIDESLNIHQLINELELEDAVILEGQVNNVHERIANAGVFVLSSLSEGMPNALMEAMTLGLPVVATDCPPGGPRELIRHEYNGLLVENDNAQALAEAIIYMIRNPQRAEEMAHNAEAVADIYCVDEIRKQWQRYFEKMKKEHEQ